MPELHNLVLIAGTALVYFAVLAGLFRLRHRLGIGAFFCPLGVMHFIETYLASIFYVTLPARIVTSPGSSVLFTGKLMLLLTYRQRYEDLLARTGRDALTGAYDRGRLETVGRDAIAAAAQAARPVSLLLIDIDNFKTFNDRLGHAAGDTVIRGIAREIMATVRASDTAFRFGGDEFVVICEDVAGEGAVALGERIRREIATNVDSEGSRVTVSIGVATTAGSVDHDSLFQLADRCLYQARAAGRNCTVGDRMGSPDAPVRLVYSV